MEHRILGDRPGERIVAKRPYIFDHDRLIAYEADAIVAAGDPRHPLARVAYLNAIARRPFDKAVIAFGGKVYVE